MGCRGARVSGGGFTLLEIIVVVLMIGLIAGLIAGSLGRSVGAARERETLGALVGILQTARIEAMETQSAKDVQVRLVGEQLNVTAGSRTRSVAWAGLVPVDERGRGVSRLRAAFDPAGRTRERFWHFAPGEGSARMRTIEFDPVSGVPSVRADAAEPG